MFNFCVQYKKAKERKLKLFYEQRFKRWLVSENDRFKKFSNLIKDFKK